MHLNTSYVDIKRFQSVEVGVIHFYLNTSFVDIKPLGNIDVKKID